MPRLFTGLELPQTHRTTLSLLQSGVPGMRWIEPSDFHITLRFIGDVSSRMANDVVDALSSRNWTAPQIKLGELKSFGGKAPTAIYASVAHDDQLASLAASQERLFQRLGLPADGRRFTPHVTLARCRGITSKKLANYLATQAGCFALPPFIPKRFVLYSARQSTGGGPYRIEETWPFEPPSAELASPIHEEDHTR